MTNIIQTQAWEEYSVNVDKIRDEYPHHAANLLFRGQSDSAWPLSTTLERRTAQNFRFLDYYKIALRIRHEIETESGIKWSVPSFEHVSSWVQEYDRTHFSSILSDQTHFNNILAYDYISHLRHNGFPSPLLDWTRSPFVAAYFAFAGAAMSANVAIYVYLESPSPYGMKVGGEGVPAIRRLGPYVGTHRRHFRQQSTYTVCANFEKNDFDGTYSWRFVNHETVFESKSPTEQDLLWKIIIPASERKKVLRILDEFNVNAFSLFDSEESHMETLAFREIDLKQRG